MDDSIEGKRGRLTLREDEVAYSEETWWRERTKRIPIDEITCVERQQRGSWFLFAIGVLAGWITASGIGALGFVDEVQPWQAIALASSVAVTAISLIAWAKIRLVQVRVSSASDDIRIAAWSSKGSGLHALASSVAQRASRDERRERAVASATA